MFERLWRLGAGAALLLGAAVGASAAQASAMLGFLSNSRGGPPLRKLNPSHCLGITSVDSNAHRDCATS